MKEKPDAGPGSSYALLGVASATGMLGRAGPALTDVGSRGSTPLAVGSVFTLCSHDLMGHVEDDLPFRVEQWDASGARLEQTLSASADRKLGRAAFTEAVRQRPAQRIVLRHKTRVIEEYK